MILLHEPKIIFLKPRKVAGTSFEIALSSFASQSSIITPISPEDEVTRSKLGFRGPQNFTYRLGEFRKWGAKETYRMLTLHGMPRKFFNHIDAFRARHRLGSEVFDAYTKVSIVRNPFDRVVSSYFWVNKHNSHPPEFEQWLLSNDRALKLNDKIYKIDDKYVVDRFIRFEQFEPDIKALQTSNPLLKNLWELFSGIHAKGKTRPSHAATDRMYREAPKAFALVCEVCAEEIEKFNFRVPEIEC